MAKIQLNPNKFVLIDEQDSAEKAAEAYDKASIKYFGKFAKLNLKNPIGFKETK
jgi:hypothetical protein